jgi:probable HAF family extracellular repeat protein
LGPVQSTGDSGKSINSIGTAAYTVSSAVYLWQSGAGISVPNLFADNGPLDINDAGHLAGADNQRAYLYRNGAKTDLGTFSGDSTFAYGLNNNDIVVGKSYDRDALRYRAFSWENGSLQRLPAPGGGTYQSGAASAAYSINASGIIVGSYDDPRFGLQAVVWSDGTATALPNYLGRQSEAYDINAAGQVVGYSINSGSGVRFRDAFLWNAGSFMRLDLPGFYFNVANAINSSAMVVGMAQTGEGIGGDAFLWTSGQNFNLNSLISPNLGWHLTSAEDINDLGQIVGYGTLNGAPESFLLTPVPEPSSIVLLSLGAISMMAGAAVARKGRE